MELMTSVCAHSDRHEPCKSAGQQIALHLQYAKIGIAAVAAAARYQSTVKSPGLSPAVVEAPRPRDATT